MRKLLRSQDLVFILPYSNLHVGEGVVGGLVGPLVHKCNPAIVCYIHAFYSSNGTHCQVRSYHIEVETRRYLAGSNKMKSIMCCEDLFFPFWRLKYVIRAMSIRIGV